LGKGGADFGNGCRMILYIDQNIGNEHLIALKNEETKESRVVGRFIEVR